jgi:glycosyltransferase involved in cell wall biosynthesis
VQAQWQGWLRGVDASPVMLGLALRRGDGEKVLEHLGVRHRKGDQLLRVAILGTRGVPANYGGFETFAEELSTRLVQRGHRVTVYSRNGNAPGNPRTFRGVEVVCLPALRNKYAETISHAFLSALHALFRNYDIVYVCNSANAPICLIPWLRRQRTVLNVDGLEWRRRKWGRIARGYYRWAGRLAARLPIEVVTDARVIQEYYRSRFGRDTRCIAYGTDLFPRGHLAERLADMGLEPDRYILYVSRMERENNAMLVVEAYRELKTDLPLVMVGDAPYAKAYVDEVRAAADERVRFLGFRFGDDYHALQSNARVFVQATEVGGTHPALVEALGHRNAVVAHDVPEHREVMGDAGCYFAYRDAADLGRILTELLASDDRIAAMREQAAARVTERYTWDAVTDAYADYFSDLMASHGPTATRGTQDAH